MMRRWLITLTLACFVASVTGLPFAAHLYLWHSEHGQDSHHDNDRCPFYQQMISASQTTVSDAPPVIVELTLSYRDCGPAAQVPRVTDAHQPAAPRAPPLFAL